MSVMEKKFKVAVDDSDEFIEIMNEFNRMYMTDFEVERTEFWDGVEFVFVSFNNAITEDVFLFGAKFTHFYHE